MDKGKIEFGDPLARTNQPPMPQTGFHEGCLPHAKEIRFIKGRLRFGDGKNPAPFPSMVCLWHSTRFSWVSLTGLGTLATLAGSGCSCKARRPGDRPKGSGVGGI